MLKCGGACSVPESNGSLDVPRAVFAGVGHISSIVAAEPIVEVVGQANVEVFGSELALEDVNVGEVSGVHF